MEEMVVNDHYNTLAMSEMGVKTHSQERHSHKLQAYSDIIISCIPVTHSYSINRVV